MEIAILGALISSLGFGIANVVIKKALETTSIPQTLITSSLCGAMLLTLLVVLGGGEQITTDLVIQFIVFAAVEVALYLCLYKAFAVADVTVAAAIISIYPILSTLLTVVFLNEQLASAKFLLVILVVAGAIITGTDWSTVRKLGIRSFEKGIGWVVLTLLLHAVYFPALGKLTAAGSWETRLLGIKVFVVLFLAVIFFVFQRTKLQLTRDRVMITAFIGILEIVGWIGLGYASNNTEGLIALIVVLGSSAPIITAIFARIFLGEKLHWLQYLGILITLSGMVLISI